MSPSIVFTKFEQEEISGKLIQFRIICDRFDRSATRTPLLLDAPEPELKKNSKTVF